MSTKFQIGYPYAPSDPSRVRASVVILKPSFYKGFRRIFYGNHIYRLPLTCRGPEILEELDKGVEGELLESKEVEKESIAKQGQIIGGGTSMQLALALAVYAEYESEVDRKRLPLLLFSGAIQKPPGLPPFLESQIMPYGEEDEVGPSLVEKFKAAQMSRAFGLVLPKRDAQILSSLVGKKVEDLEILDTKNHSETPYIIGVSSHSLPLIAEKIGISPYYYKKSRFHAPFSWAFSLVVLLSLIYGAATMIPHPQRSQPPRRSSPVKATPQKPKKIFMVHPRIGMAVSLLPNGKILMAGGTSRKDQLTPLKIMEVFDPFTRTCKKLKGIMKSRRNSAQAYLLPNEQVLIAGGLVEDSLIITDSAEILDPVKEETYLIDKMNYKRWNTSICPMGNNQLLLTGGFESIKKVINGKFVDGRFLKEVEIFDLASRKFQKVPSMAFQKMGHISALSPEGKVFIFGGWCGPSKIFRSLDIIEVFDPNTKEFRQVGKLLAPRSDMVAIPYFQKGIFFFGGYDTRTREFVDVAEFFEWKTLKSKPLPSPPYHTGFGRGCFLPNGKILLLGEPKKKGLGNPVFYFDPKKNRYEDPHIRLETYREFQAALIPLSSGEVAIIGGTESGEIEIFRPPYMKAKKRPCFASFNGFYNRSTWSYHQGDKVTLEGWGFFRGKTKVILLSFAGLGNPLSVPFLLELTPQKKDFFYTMFDIQLPPNSYQMPPGHYYCFIVVNGIPSRGLNLHLLAKTVETKPHPK
ncbi:MAG: DUF1929 domain-containing protein [Planctomycetota bacterium]|nr:MAG: DUF1929 domain-containing protein [Planctomycetota bacterium]